PLSALFPLQCAPAPPALPAFPTRRSSDLRSDAIQWTQHPPGQDPPDESADHDQDTEDGGGPGCKRIDQVATVRHESGIRRDRPRSEEHTSELQSRENIVCRLLLEKQDRQA